ncbi:SseB family protein [Cumulibacter manganitolerans]|uniref:SseB family protein n=1 Tax=Cumulibacter manganitolerans TaxID=1884992 RepID=UPI001294D954|nr:SseB family protein [Cumulibacter manganitolerans]
MTGPLRAELPWTAASDFERELQAAFSAGDTARCWGLLMPAQLVMPTTRAAQDGREETRWPTYADDERTFVTAYTSFEAMSLASSGSLVHGAVTRLDELAAAWPDPAFGLAVNPGLGVAFYLESGMVARLAAPPIELLDTPEGRFELVLQKALPRGAAERFVTDRVSTVSGYCQLYWHVEHISSPRVLVESLALPADDYLNEAGAAFVLRWRPLALGLYADAYGGETPRARDLVGGTIVEEPPFTGLGFGPGRGQVIRELKANRAPLPTGAEIWEITDGAERRVALFDGAAGGWRLIARAGEVLDTRADGPPPRGSTPW